MAKKADGNPEICVQNCGLIDVAHVRLTFSPSAEEMTPIRPISTVCSRQSNRDNRTVEARRNPADCQSANSTSNTERALTVVTAAATTSAPSSHRTKTGRFLLPDPLVKRMFATQNSPARIVIVQPFVLGCVTIQQRGVIANKRGLNFDRPLFGSRGNGNRHNLMLIKLKRCKRPKHPSFIDGMDVESHTESITSLPALRPLRSSPVVRGSPDPRTRQAVCFAPRSAAKTIPGPSFPILGPIFPSGYTYQNIATGLFTGLIFCL